MKTIIFIHGGMSFSNEEEYVFWLKDTYTRWSLESWKPSVNKWRNILAEKCFTAGNTLYIPEMPCDLHAKYKEWKIIFEHITTEKKENDPITLIGYSLGGCFLLKYFSEISKTDPLMKSVENIHLVAACIEAGGFTAPTNYNNLNSFGNKVHIWHSQDDTVVPFSIGQELSNILPEACPHFFGSVKGYGHFHKLERFEELEIEILKP